MELELEKEKQSYLQSQVAMSEVLAEIQDAKETKRKPKISHLAIEKNSTSVTDPQTWVC